MQWLFVFFTKIKKGLGTSFWCTFSAWLVHKNVPYLILYHWTKFQSHIFLQVCQITCLLCLMCQCTLHAYVPQCLKLLHAYVPYISMCLLVLIFYVLTCPHFSRAYVLTCLYILFMPTCLTFMKHENP